MPTTTRRNLPVSLPPLRYLTGFAVSTLASLQAAVYRPRTGGDLLVRIFARLLFDAKATTVFATNGANGFPHLPSY